MSFVSFERTGTLKPIPRKSQEQKVNKCTFLVLPWKTPASPAGNGVMTPRLMGIGPAKFGRLWQVVAAF